MSKSTIPDEPDPHPAAENHKLESFAAAAPWEADAADVTELRGLLSALVDGHGGESAAAAACEAWAVDPSAQRVWHEYQVVGDLLRSADLGAVSSDRDKAFIMVMRSRLALESAAWPQELHQDEPGVREAPASAVAAPGLRTARRWQPWWTPAAVAAGVMLVAAALVVTRESGPVGVQGAGQLALGDRAVVPGAAQTTREGTVGSAVIVDPRIIRDARLDEYLQAHRAAAPSQALRPAVSGLQNVDMLLPPGGAAK